MAQVAPAVRIDVDAGHDIGPIKPLRGVNGAPDLSWLPADGFAERMGPAQDVSENYRRAAVSLVRTHDARGAADLDLHTGPLPPLPTPFPQPTGARQALDLNVLFPRLNADPNDPASYNFAPTDRLLNEICAVGADVMFRIGRSGMATAAIPTDAAKYHEIIRHVVLHYNKGWANGFQDRVRYWEVWNEPDLGHIWWRGTPEQFYAFYATAAKAVKAADPATMVGGPAIAVVNEPSPYREGFLAYARDHRLPLDFFSWHWYSTDADDPYDFNIIGGRMRALLDIYDFRRTLSVLDEWNLDFQKAQAVPPMRRAAYVASARIYMQDAPIDLDAYYRADFELRNPPNKVGFALIAGGRMAETPIRLAARGADSKGLAVLAGRSQDGRRMQVLVSNYEVPPELRGKRAGPDVMHVPGLFDLKLLPRRELSYPMRGGYRVNVAGLPRGRWAMEHYRLDERNDLVLVGRAAAADGTPVLTSSLAAPMVDLFVLTRAD